MRRTLRTAWHDLRAAHNDTGFRAVLTRMARTGTAVGALLGLTAVLLFVGLHVLVLGKTPGWRYGVSELVLWDKVVLAGLCVGALAVARRLWLNSARLMVALIVLVAAFASVADDVAAGDTSFTPGYLTFMYLLAVAAVPYRPGQALGLGAALGLVLFGAMSWLPDVLGQSSIDHTKGHYVYILIITVLLVGVSGLLYVSRYRQYRARSEAERLREQVQALEDAKSRFFTNISHEFRTPLTLIIGPVEDALAGRHGPLGASLHRRLEHVQHQARRLRGLIDQLLDLAKLEAGAMPLQARQHDLGTFVQRQAAAYRASFSRRGIALHVEVPEGPLMVWFDIDRMERVVWNLLSNALKHTPDGGAVRVRVEARPEASQQDEAGEAVFSVRNSGAGLDPDVVSSAFDRFAAAGGNRTGQASTGIGLALVKEIADRHGGSVEVSSEPGFGAEFTVALKLGHAHLDPQDMFDGKAAVRKRAEAPAEDVQPAEWAQAPGEQDWWPEEAVEIDATPGAEAPLVLVADDDDDLRRYLVELLGADYRVVEAADGASAWQCVQEQQPALVVSDVMMPELDGFDLCRRVREDEHLATTPVVLLTARAEEEARLEGWQTGADAYLAKPFSSDELLAIAEHLIEVRALLRERVPVPDWMEPVATEVPTPEADLLRRVHEVVRDHIGDSGFGVNQLADEVGLSARHLQRRLKKLTRLTAASFIKTMRLRHAADLLRHHPDLQVQEVAQAVGYTDANYFSRLFRQAYGMPPSEYMKDPT